MNDQTSSLAQPLSANLRHLLSMALLACLLSIHASVDAASTGTEVRSAGSVGTNHSFDRSKYRLGILYFNVSQDDDDSADGGESKDVIDIVLVPPQGEVIGKRVGITLDQVRDLSRSMHESLVKKEPLVTDDPASPARNLHRALIEPIAADLERLGITTLILAPDVGLQGLPFAALHDGRMSFGTRYGFSITPAVSLLRRETPGRSGTEPKQLLALGVTQIEGQAPLSLVPQEIERIAALGPSERYMDQSFTPDILIERASTINTRQVHVASQVEFNKGSPSRSRLHTGAGAMDFSRLVALRQRRAGDPIDLFVLSSSRIMLNDKDSELSFAGLAAQTGARSAIGSLWAGDDVATSAFFVQFYRFLNQGLPKAEALLATRRSFLNGQITLRGNQLLDAEGRPLLDALSPQQVQRVEAGFQHPYFWAGVTLLGTPW